MAKKPVAWQHVDESGRVLLLKCVDKDGKGYGGFQWPRSGRVLPKTWSPEPTCESGGLFGWAWGLNIGGGKEPDYSAIWIVFAAAPVDVVDLGDKQKVREAEVVYFGGWHGASDYLAGGRAAFFAAVRAWAEVSAQGAASSTGYQGAASSTGYQGAASSTGSRGAASSTGVRGVSSSTGYQGAASSTGELSTLEVGPTGLACTTASRVFWRYHTGAVLVQRCEAGVFLFEHVKAKDGDLLEIANGNIVG